MTGGHDGDSVSLPNYSAIESIRQLLACRPLFCLRGVLPVVVMVVAMSRLMRGALVDSLRILRDGSGLRLDVSRVLLDLRNDIGIMAHDDTVALRVCRNGACSEKRKEQGKRDFLHGFFFTLMMISCRWTDALTDAAQRWPTRPVPRYRLRPRWSRQVPSVLPASHCSFAEHCASRGAWCASDAYACACASCV